MGPPRMDSLQLRPVRASVLEMWRGSCGGRHGSWAALLSVFPRRKSDPHLLDLASSYVFRGRVYKPGPRKLQCIAGTDFRETKAERAVIWVCQEPPGSRIAESSGVLVLTKAGPG